MAGHIFNISAQRLGLFIIHPRKSRGVWQPLRCIVLLQNEEEAFQGQRNPDLLCLKHVRARDKVMARVSGPSRRGCLFLGSNLHWTPSPKEPRVALAGQEGLSWSQECGLPSAEPELT